MGLEARAVKRLRIKFLATILVVSLIVNTKVLLKLLTPRPFFSNVGKTRVMWCVGSQRNKTGHAVHSYAASPSQGRYKVLKSGGARHL